MDILQAKQLVVQAGKKLVESGLIARTWGNVSCRVSNTQFVITPSGRAYETLTPEEIVLVNIADLSYDGDIKPSSEKGIHAQAYELRPGVNFVIHTHQVNASIVSALGYDINMVAPQSAAIVGDNVPCASYGLPGTGKLRQGVVDALLRSDSKAVIMAHHGALCVGKDYDEAFAVASELEKICARYLLDRYTHLTDKVSDTLSSLGEYFLNYAARAKQPPVTAALTCYDSEREGAALRLYDKAGTAVGKIDVTTGGVLEGDCPAEAELHRAVYEKRKDIHAIVHSKDADILTVSQAGRTMRPLLDDFAQIAGATVRVACFNPNTAQDSAKRVVRKLRGRSGVLLRNNGALCCGPNKYDAQATELVMDKGCKTQIGASLFKNIKPINPIETRLMRFIYMTKYSKQASKK